MTTNEIHFDVLSSKSGFVQRLGHSEMVNTFTQHNHVKAMTTKKRFD